MIKETKAAFKRVAFISYHSCPLVDEEGAEVGGMNIYILELTKKLSEKGMVIDIFTRSIEEKTPKVVVVNKNLRIIHLRAGEQTKIDKNKLKLHLPEFIKSFNEFTKKEGIEYNLLSCHYYLSGQIGVEIRKYYRRYLPVILTFHTLALMKNLVARSKEETEGIERIKVELQLVKQVDKVIAASQKDALYLETLYDCPPKKIVILTPGADLEVFKPMDKTRAKKIINAPSNHKLVLYVGRIAPLKGIDVLLYAIKILLKKDPKFCFNLWIIGGSSKSGLKELQRLQEIKNLLKITTSVKFINQKSHQKLKNYYNAADLVVMPSHYESFGLAAIEAMACGTPVIATDVSGISNLIDKTHDLSVTSANNPILLADKINDILKKVNKKLSLDLFEKVRDLSWDNVAKSYIQILNTL